jgi:signal transduction histidine kinase
MKQTEFFEKGFRGKNAELVRTNGTGLGLSVARKVIETFNGKLSAKQSSRSELRGNIYYAETTFHFSLPTSGEDNVRRRKHETLSRQRAYRRIPKHN